MEENKKILGKHAILGVYLILLVFMFIGTMQIIFYRSASNMFNSGTYAQNPELVSPELVSFWISLQSLLVQGAILAVLALVACIAFIVLDFLLPVTNRKQKLVKWIVRLSCKVFALFMLTGLAITVSQFANVVNEWHGRDMDFSYRVMAQESMFMPLAALVGLVVLGAVMIAMDIIKFAKEREATSAPQHPPIAQ